MICRTWVIPNSGSGIGRTFAPTNLRANSSNISLINTSYAYSVTVGSINTIYAVFTVGISTLLVLTQFQFNNPGTDNDNWVEVVTCKDSEGNRFIGDFFTYSGYVNIEFMACTGTTITVTVIATSAT